jgi:predicted MFS family arabinose efflux permease
MTESTQPTGPSAQHERLFTIVCALGIAQIISWGSFYYSIAVLGESMRRDLGVSETVLFGAFTFSLLLSGLAAPMTGKLIDERGGRLILSLGSCVGAAALLLLATATGPITLVLGSAMAGVAMAACLYDAAFASMNQIAGASYRKAVTALTLFGGFASTAFWPLSQVLLDAMGWRMTLAVYAGLQLFICLPLHRRLLPAHRAAAAASQASAAAGSAPSPATADYAWLAAAFALGSFVLSVLSVHVISLLKSAGLGAKDAVLVASLFGPMQVLGRLLELAVARNIRPMAIGTISFALMVLALVTLFFVQGLSPLAFLFAALYGFSNGLMTIIRGTVPAALFGRVGYGALLGKLARPAFIARALAPVAFSVAMTAGLVRGNAILALAACAALSLAAYQLAVKKASRLTQRTVEKKV